MESGRSPYRICKAPTTINALVKITIRAAAGRAFAGADHAREMVLQERGVRL
jgi:hypothetical protein